MKRPSMTVGVIAVIVVLAAFIFFVPVVGQTKTVWAHWATLTNGMDTTQGGCPAHSTCVGEPIGWGIHYTASLSYYFLKVGGYDVQGTITVWVNGSIDSQNYAGSTYIFATGDNPCFAGSICLGNTTKVVVLNSTTSA